MAGSRRGRPRTCDETQTLNNQRGKFQITWDPGEANPKQKMFFEARTTFIAYGGAKGGGKTWAVRTKAVGGAICNPGIKILIMRRTYPELEENHIQPIVSSVNPSIGVYNSSLRMMTFFNGSTIKFGHWPDKQAELEYQGQEFDWIFIDEATQFTERAFNYLKGCLRGVRGQEVGGYPKRMYLTCNPGGVGHRWVKRLFIDRDYIHDPDNPEGWEDSDDYTFIPATVEDNTAMLESSPMYLKMLAQMPENQRKAYRYGDWDALGGSYFPEFRLDTHVCAPFRIPDHWTRYRSIDYGLDMLAVYWIAVDEQGRSWVYREYTRDRLIVQDAARNILDNTLPGEQISVTFAPPDLWSTQKDTGRTMAEIFMTCGVSLQRASNNRVQGHMMIKNLLAPMNDGKPGLMIFKSCRQLINDLRDIQADEINPNDCAKEPHELTHTVDSLRYYCVSRTLPGERPAEAAYEEEDDLEEYDEFMTGGEATAGYLTA